MLGVQLPSSKNITNKIASKPIAIPNKRECLHGNQGTNSKSSSPPSVFMEHLRKRMDQMATSPEFMYNLRN